MILPQEVVRIGFLYIPLVACGVLFLVKKPAPRHAVGALLALLWAMPALLLVELLARSVGWWTISAPAGVFPIAADVWLGWALAWGPLPALLLWRRPVVALLVAWWIDVCMMPAALNLVTLGREWLVGELTALTFVLLPGLLITRWTIERRSLKARTVMQMLIFGAWTLWIIPLAAHRYRPTDARPLWFLLIALAPFGIVAASAVQEFVRRGEGTPVPFDPPARLVTSGPYAYVANPMQLSMTLVLLGLAGVLRSPLLALAAVVATVYGSGLAEWHEGLSMYDRFGERWVAYRSQVHAWRPRLRPYIADGSMVYVASTCDLCSGVGGWIARRRPVGLRIAPAEELDDPPRRMMYVPGDGGPADHGVAAFARALEHINVLWALVGFGLRLPVVRPFIQVVVDACGGGPRDIQSLQCASDPARAA